MYKKVFDRELAAVVDNEVGVCMIDGGGAAAIFSHAAAQQQEGQKQ